MILMLTYGTAVLKEGYRTIGFRVFIKELARVANISKKKDVWLYLFRHSALTEYEKTYGSSITEVYGNWIKRLNYKE